MNEDEPKPTAEADRPNVAHAIRNSLGAIRTAAELLERHYSPQGRERRLFQVMLTEIDRLGKLTDEELGVAPGS
jgi:nitrogen-specific signal transduction histidine kinase